MRSIRMRRINISKVVMKEYRNLSVNQPKDVYISTLIGTTASNSSVSIDSSPGVLILVTIACTNIRTVIRVSTEK